MNGQSRMANVSKAGGVVAAIQRETTKLGKLQHVGALLP